MKFRPLAIGALALALLLAACGGGKDDTNSGDRPSVDAITTALQQDLDDEGVAESEPIARCAAEEIHSSKLPNGVLRAFVDGREAEVDEDNLEEYQGILEGAIFECLEAALDDIDMDDPELPDDVDLDDLELPDED